MASNRVACTRHKMMPHRKCDNHRGINAGVGLGNSGALLQVRHEMFLKEKLQQLLRKWEEALENPYFDSLARNFRCFVAISGVSLCFVAISGFSLWVIWSWRATHLSITSLLHVLSIRHAKLFFKENISQVLSNKDADPIGNKSLSKTFMGYPWGQTVTTLVL